VSWPAHTHFGIGRDPVSHGRVSGAKAKARAAGKVPIRSAEWLRGYQAGWRASERWFEAADRTKRGRGRKTA
jgi:hypothetical protein